MTTSGRIIIGRPMLEGEVSEAIGVSRRRLKGLLEHHRIRPAFRLGRSRLACYSPDQVERLHSLVEAS